MSEKVVIGRLPTGVPGLNEVLGGGIPEFSFNLIVGPPGVGKTSLAHQMMFSLASSDRRAIFFTVLGEPPLKMLRYQQQYSFFDVAKVEGPIRYVNLATATVQGDLDQVMASIVAEVEEFQPSFVFVDSFWSVVQDGARVGDLASRLQIFVQQLGMFLTSRLATTFLIGEFHQGDAQANPVFTVADGVLQMSQKVHGNSVVRKLQVTKLRGQAPAPGLHTFRIDGDGVQVFPRSIVRSLASLRGNVTTAPDTPARLSLGVPELDEMLGGGIPAGYSLLVAGPSGSGKTVLAVGFMAEGARLGEKSVVAAFETSPSNAEGSTLAQMIADGRVDVIDTRTLDLSIDELLHALAEKVRLGATRVVIDSISGLELALAPAFRDDFREAMHRMVAVLTGLGATVLMVCELEDRYTELRFSPYGAAFLTDAIVVQRYVEWHGVIERVMAVVKVRASRHSKELRLYEINDAGILIHEPRPELEALLTGHPQASGPSKRFP
jgi:circadian clock protein KaiC